MDRSIFYPMHPNTIHHLLSYLHSRCMPNSHANRQAHLWNTRWQDSLDGSMLPKVCVPQSGSRQPITDACSGFSPPSIDDEYLCTSAITAPMAFLLDPNISTTDVYTTLPPELWIEHDQLTVQWEPSDLELFPLGAASQYELMMGITAPPSTEDAATGTTEFIAASTTAPKQ